MNARKIVKQNLLYLFESICDPKLQPTFVDDMKRRGVGLFDAHSSYPFLNGIFQDKKLEREYFLSKLESRRAYFEIQGNPFTYWLNSDWKVDFEHEELQKAGLEYQGTFRGVRVDLDKFEPNLRELPEGFFIRRVDTSESFEVYKDLSKAVFAEENFSMDAIHEAMLIYPDRFHNYVLWDDHCQPVASMTVLDLEKTISLQFAAVIPEMRKKGLFSHLLSYILSLYKDLHYDDACSVYETGALGLGPLKAAGFEYTQEFYVYVRHI